MKISYDAELRAKAKELNRGLFTIEIPGMKAQGMSDKELEKDLYQAWLAYHERGKAAKKPEAAR